LDWNTVPERCLDRNWGRAPVPYRAFIAACLVKLDQGLAHMSQLRRYLKGNPALAWLLGFNPRLGSPSSGGSGSQSALPTQRHFARMLRSLPNAILQALLDSSVIALRTELSDPDFGQVISLDTKHILAWVPENNPKHSVQDRFDKTKQPAGDPDCRLGCKKRHNRRVVPPTPTENPIPAGQVNIGEFYWGYTSGVVVTKIAGQAEVVLAEFTQSFDHSDEGDEPKPVDVDGAFGVDLGATHIAVDRDGQGHSTSQINNVRQRHRRLRAKLQANPTRSAKRKLKRWSGKERRFAQDTHPGIRQKLVAQAKDTHRAIALEDLGGIRKRVTVRRSRRATWHRWVFFPLRSCVTCKAKRVGVPVFLVDPRNTSCTCPAGGLIDKANRPSQSRFSGVVCGYAGLADHSVAVNISRRAAVHPPIVVRDEAKAVLTELRQSAVTSHLL